MAAFISSGSGHLGTPASRIAHGSFGIAHDAIRVRRADSARNSMENAPVAASDLWAVLIHQRHLLRGLLCRGLFPHHLMRCVIVLSIPSRMMSVTFDRVLPLLGLGLILLL
jgi:hypothetical protein